MNDKKVLVFDIWGDYGHFRKIETTTSPLTYSIPTGTAISGLIAAVLGLPRDSYYNQFSKENVRFAIKILHPIKKVRMNLNLIDTSTEPFFALWGKKNPRTQIPFEFLKEPNYRIFVWLKKQALFNKLKEYLESHWSVYTPYLGISELIANFRFIGEFEAEPRQADGVEVNSVVRKDRSKIGIEEVKETMRWVRETIPLYMNGERVVQEYGEILFETNGKPLTLKRGEFYKIGDDNVIFI
ncbi:type I-B CRISPR-associated protein Cas5 [Candidatus Pacearchaeota archaeon]|nr:type I-B CRISPR-associated protein Cas5 [Candidatus Pacearchaeota archaeon]